MGGLTLTSSVSGTIVMSILSNTGLIVPITGIFEKMVDRAFDEYS